MSAACENCGKPVPLGDDDDALGDGWVSGPDGGDWDAGTMWFCPACQGDDPLVEALDGFKVGNVQLRVENDGVYADPRGEP